MNRVENFWLLDPNRRQFVDIEEAPIIDLVGGNAPEAQAIGLVLQQPFKPIEAARVAFNAVNFCKRYVNGCADIGAGFGQRRETTLDHFLLPQALLYSRLVGFGTQR